MSMIERFIFWTAILILLIAVIGVKSDLENLEKKAKEASSYVVSTDEDGGDEE
ncbi:hypothetical protein [Persephonella sp.]